MRRRRAEPERSKQAGIKQRGKSRTYSPPRKIVGAASLSLQRRSVKKAVLKKERPTPEEVRRSSCYFLFWACLQLSRRDRRHRRRGHDDRRRDPVFRTAVWRCGCSDRLAKRGSRPPERSGDRRPPPGGSARGLR